MSVEMQYCEVLVRCDFTSPLQCPNQRHGTKNVLELGGWLFVNNTPYIEEARAYCPIHAKEIIESEK